MSISAPLTETDLQAPTRRIAKISARPRRAMLDVVRLLAAYAIVWLHTPRSPELAGSTAIGRAAVPFFVCATIFFIWQGVVEQPARRFGSYAASRFERLYVPFLAWSAIYLAFKWGKSLFMPELPNDFPGFEFLWTGSFYHLWFMPFILVVSLGTFLAARWLVVRPAAEMTAGLAGLVAGTLVAVAPVPAAVVGTSAEFPWNALPAVCWGVALSVLMHRKVRPWLESGAAAAMGLAVAVVCIAWVWRFGRDNLAENLAGVGLSLVALAPTSAAWLARLGKFGPQAYGIYLSHLLFIKVAESLLARLGMPLSWQVDIGVFVFAAIGSSLLAWSLAQTRYTRWLAA
ncbi:MAG TPA: acyltransferase [Pirellulales bacterium]|nr:acyltransferase [Pirellulales bacterium]